MASEDKKVRVSIIIPTYNRAKILVTLLEHIAKQSDQDFEVVVAIDGSNDDTESVLANVKVPYPLKWVNTHCPGYGLAVARNLGVLAANGDIVAIIDDDSFPSINYVDACKRSAKHGVITGGPRVPSDAREERQLAKMRELAKLPPLEPMKFDVLRKTFPIVAITECNMFMFKDDFIAMGMFSERLKMYGFIGQEFFARATYLGLSYQYNPNAEIVHARQMEGAEGLNDARKRREIRIAGALYSSFANPLQFAKQIAWAKDMACAYPTHRDLPPFPKSAILDFPYRFARARLRDVRHRLRDRKR